MWLLLQLFFAVFFYSGIVSGLRILGVKQRLFGATTQQNKPHTYTHTRSRPLPKVSSRLRASFREKCAANGDGWLLMRRPSKPGLTEPTSMDRRGLLKQSTIVARWKEKERERRDSEQWKIIAMPTPFQKHPAQIDALREFSFGEMGIAEGGVESGAKCGVKIVPCSGEKLARVFGPLVLIWVRHSASLKMGTQWLASAI